ncbi:hypothetical protein SUGI_1169410 [Cryptomeria japonica]|uniref:heat shock 70 kDa protein 8-like n=1 Tax=Cryptomeria japonica TaxID=3369 RepID=UPI0024149BCB|nr:heat shock 70 kDa protein 8-like [Cryptomeria japonica]GLJ54447.1 hypothetical protein SUGI_1169410 [Cryptomeria japonica]
MRNGVIGYTVASNNEAMSDDVGGENPFVETAIGIDVGTYECHVEVWMDSKVELLRNLGGQRMMSSYVLFQGDIPYHQPQPLELLSRSVILNVKMSVGRMDTDPIMHNSQNFPFMIETLEIGVRQFIATLSSGVWHSTTPKEVLAILLMELRVMAEVHLGRVVHNVDAANVLSVFIGMTKPESKTPIIPYVEVRMLIIDDDHGVMGELVFEKNSRKKCFDFYLIWRRLI